MLLSKVVACTLILTLIQTVERVTGVENGKNYSNYLYAYYEKLFDLSSSGVIPDGIQQMKKVYEAGKDISSPGGKRKNLDIFTIQVVFDGLSQILPKTVEYYAGDELNISSSHTQFSSIINNRYSVILPCDKDFWVHSGLSKDLPSIDDVWEKLFLRKPETYKLMTDESEVPMNFLLVAFVNWLHDDAFKTEKNTNGVFHWANGLGLRLTQVYGHTLERQTVLRTQSGGKMRTSLIQGQVMPPLITDIKKIYPNFDVFNSTYGINHIVDEKQAFATGDPRYNTHAGSIAFLSIFIKMHNDVCEIIANERPHYNDQEIFETAQLIVYHVSQKIRLENFVMQTLSHIRDFANIKYDPDDLRVAFKSFRFHAGKVPAYYEFNHLYRWHNIIPDNIKIEKKTQPGEYEEFSFGDNFVFNNSMFFEKGLASVVDGFIHTPASEWAPRNTPDYLKYATTRAISNERNVGLQTFNNYRRRFGLKAFTDFNEFGLDEDTTLAFRTLYNDNIESVEFYVGIHLEKANIIPGNPIGDMQLFLVCIFAFQDFINMETIQNPILWDEQILTKAGKQFIVNYDFNQHMSEVSKKKTECAFFFQDKCAKGVAAADQKDESSIENIGDFCGMDEYILWVFYGSYGHDFFAQIVAYTLISYFCLIMWYGLWAWTIKKIGTFKYQKPNNSLNRRTTTKNTKNMSKNTSTVKNDDVRQRGIGVNSMTNLNPGNENDYQDNDEDLQLFKTDAGRKFLVNRTIFSITFAHGFALLLLCIPFTIVTCKLMFSNNQELIIADYIVPYFVMCLLIIGIYTVEACFRAVLNMNKLIMVHHLLTILLGVFIPLLRSVFALKVNLILIGFVPWEFGVYFSFIFYRLKWNENRLFVYLITPFVLLIYFITRVLQVVLLLYLFAVSGRRMVTISFADSHSCALFFIYLFASCFLVTLQFYTMKTPFLTWLKSFHKLKKNM